MFSAEKADQHLDLRPFTYLPWRRRVRLHSASTAFHGFSFMPAVPLPPPLYSLCPILPSPAQMRPLLGSFSWYLQIFGRLKLHGTLYLFSSWAFLIFNWQECLARCKCSQNICQLKLFIYMFHRPSKAGGSSWKNLIFCIHPLISPFLNWHFALKSPFCWGEPHVDVPETVPFQSFRDVAL